LFFQTWLTNGSCTQIWKDVLNKIGKINVFGDLFVQKVGSTLYYEFHLYNSSTIYDWTYSTINEKGESESHEIQTTDGNTRDNTVTFINDDGLDPSAWTDVPVLESDEKHSSIFNKISTMFKNVRYLYKMIGTTDISSIGNGTITEAVNALNTNLTKQPQITVTIDNLITVTGIKTGLFAMIQVLVQPLSAPKTIDLKQYGFSGFEPALSVYPGFSTGASIISNSLNKDCILYVNCPKLSFLSFFYILKNDD